MENYVFQACFHPSILSLLMLLGKVGSDSAFQSPPIFGDFPFPPPFFPFFSVIFSCGHALLKEALSVLWSIGHAHVKNVKMCIYDDTVVNVSVCE